MNGQMLFPDEYFFAVIASMRDVSRRRITLFSLMRSYLVRLVFINRRTSLPTYRTLQTFWQMDRTMLPKLFYIVKYNLTLDASQILQLSFSIFHLKHLARLTRSLDTRGMAQSLMIEEFLPRFKAVVAQGASPFEKMYCFYVRIELGHVSEVTIAHVALYGTVYTEDGLVIGGRIEKLRSEDRVCLQRPDDQLVAGIQVV